MLRGTVNWRRVGLPFGMACSARPAWQLAVRLSAGQGNRHLRLDAPWLFERSGNRMSTRAACRGPTNHLRYGLLSQAGAQLAAGALDPHWAADVLHATTGMRPGAGLLRRTPATPVRSVFTDPHLAFQGRFPMEVGAALGFPALATWCRPRSNLRRPVVHEGRG